jgi:hypothetical protein
MKENVVRNLETWLPCKYTKFSLLNQNPYIAKVVGLLFIGFILFYSWMLMTMVACNASNKS